jgi:hypothetical protein
MLISGKKKKIIFVIYEKLLFSAKKRENDPFAVTANL